MQKINNRLGFLTASVLPLGAAAFFFTANQPAIGSEPAERPAPAHRQQVVDSPVPAKPYQAAVFPYQGGQFTQFIHTSYENAPAGTPDFYAFMERAYKSHPTIRFKGHEKAATLAALLSVVNKDYAVSENDAAQRTVLEKQMAGFSHRLIKKGIKKFSLDHGFEFYSAVNNSQRQCYLQSVLVSGLMQAAGMKAGVVMVARNEHGQATNNGHAVALVKLSSGKDVLVDVSHKQAFIRQQGLMVADPQTNHYRYVSPVYAPTGDTIVEYSAYEGPDKLPIDSVAALPFGFVESQFDYYRGERAPGGFNAKSSAQTPAGLEASARFLNRAITEDPQNPLPQYVLGRVYLRQNKMPDARRQIVLAYHLYESYGFVPQGPHDSLALVGASSIVQAVAQR